MEQTSAGEAHGDVIFVGGLDDIVVTDRAAGLGDVAHAGLAGALHVVAEGEEGITAHSHAGQLSDPLLLFLGGEYLGLDLEGVLPHAVGQNVLILIGGVNIDSIVPKVIISPANS